MKYNRPLRAVLGYNTADSEAIVITAYEPVPDTWSEHDISEKNMKCVIGKHGIPKRARQPSPLEWTVMTLVVKDVPARVSTNCGEDYMDEHVAFEILTLAERMAKSGAPGDARR